jgi:hypothetical protein
MSDPAGIKEMKESPMLRKSTILAIAASAVLGLAMLSPTTADARGFGGGGGFHRGGGGGMHISHVGRGFHGGGMHFRRFGRVGHFGRFHRWHHWRHRHHWAWRGCWHHHYRGGCHGRAWWYPRPVVYGSYAVAQPVAGPCTCLSKEYTPEGAVLFKDNCTNEMAMNPPAVEPTAEVAPPQQPQAAYVPQYPPQQTTATQ